MVPEMPPAIRQGTQGAPDICPMCDVRPHIEHSIYCRECGKFLLHKPEASARAVAMVRVRSKNPPGFRCYYTGRLLELYDTKSPYYASFDHRTPGKKGDRRSPDLPQGFLRANGKGAKRAEGDLVMCARWVNSVKGTMTEEEFWPVVLALDDYHFKGIPFPIELARLKHWHGNAPVKAIPSPKQLPLGQSAEFCEICGAKPPPRRKYCAICSAFVYRAGENLARVSAMKRACRKGVFFCEYTGLPLELSDTESPLYIEFDHPVPAKKGLLRAVAAFVNRMKTDLSEEEFWAVIHELARFWREGGTFRDVIEFRYWLRTVRPQVKRGCVSKKSA